MSTVDTVNDKDLKAAISLAQDIYLYGPLSFKAISVSNLYTNDLISNIDFNQWTTNSFRSWGPQRQVVTGHWTVRNAAIDSIYSNSGVNGVDAAAFLTKIDSANRNLYQNYRDACKRVQALVDESQKNVIYLSHFEIAFKLAHEARVDSIYLFDIGRENYLLTNAGCWTSLHYWNHQTQRYERLSNAYTGVVNGWIHLLDLRNVLHFVSNGEQANAKTGCSISGANIWKYESETQQIVAVAAFGSAGDFRSMQVKPDSPTHFYALRVRDSRVIEFNLNGAPVTEWIVDQVQPRESAWSFMPASANLGLAISNGESLSLLANEATMLLTPKKWEMQQQETQRTIAKLRKAFADYNVAKKVIFNDGALSGKYDARKLEEIRERVRKIDESMVPHANELIETLENGLHATANAATMNQSDPEVGRSFGGSLRDIIIHELDSVTGFVTGEDSDESSEEEGLFSNFHLGLLGNPQQTNGGEVPSNRKYQSSSNDEAIVGDNFGDLMDNVTPMDDVLFDKLMEQIRQRKTNQYSRTESTYAEVGNARNSTMRPDDVVVGDQFGDLIENLTPVADDAFDKLMDYIRKRKTDDLEDDGVYDLESVRNVSEISADDAFVGDLFSYLQGKIQLELIRYRDTNGPNVGDQFGELMDNLTPAADSLFDQLMDKIEMQKRRRRPILVDDFTRSTHTNVNATMHDIVQWIQNQRPMHYDPFNQDGNVGALKTDKTVDKIGQAIQEAVKGLRGTEQQNGWHRKTENIDGARETQRVNPLAASEVATSEDRERSSSEHPHIHPINVDPSHIKHLPGHAHKTVHNKHPSIHPHPRAESAQDNLAHIDDDEINRNSDSDPMVGDSEHFHKYADTLHKYIEIAKGIYNRGKMVFEEIKGMKDDNTDASADYAAPESHHNPHQSHQHKSESHYSSNTSDATESDQQEDDRPHWPSFHESNISPQSQHASNDHFDNKSHSDQSTLDYRPEENRPVHNDFDMPKPHRPHQHESNISPQTHHQSIENFDDNEHANQQESDYRPHQTDFDTPPESHWPQHRPHHRPHHHNSHRPHKTDDPESQIDGHRPNLSDSDIPPEDIRFAKLHKNTTNMNQAVINATKHQDRYADGLHGLTENEQDLQSTHQEDDAFLEFSHTDGDGNESDPNLDTDPIVGDGHSNRWVYAFRKCTSFVKQIYHSGKKIVAKMKNETRRSDSMVGSVHGITPNHLNPQASNTTVLSINRLGDLSSLVDSDPQSTDSDASDFHEDTEDLLNQLKTIHDKYRHTDIGDSSEDQFRSDVHNVFVQMEQVIAKYEKNAETLNREYLESSGRLKRRDKLHVKRIEAMSVQMPNPHISSPSNNEIVAVTVGPEQRTLIIATSQRENVIKGAHDSIQVKTTN